MQIDTDTPVLSGDTPDPVTRLLAAAVRTARSSGFAIVRTESRFSELAAAFIENSTLRFSISPNAILFAGSMSSRTWVVRLERVVPSTSPSPARKE